MTVPAACAGIEDVISTLEAARAGLYEDLQSAAPGAKAKITIEIGRLDDRIGDLRKELLHCVAANTPIPTTPSLTVALIEVIQVIQTPTDGAALIAGKRTGVRVFVTSGLPGGPGFPPGTGFVSQVTGSLVVRDVATGATATLQPLNPSAVISAPPAVLLNLNDPTQSLLFELPAGFVTGTTALTATAGVVGQPSVTSPPSSKTVTFAPQPSQEIVPILLSDPVLLLQPPTKAAFAATLAAARGKMPIADGGFIVKSTIETGLSPGIDLTSTSGWQFLVFNLATWVFLFPTQDVGGLRTALVPNDGRYALNGIATPRVGFAVPASASRVGLGTTVAHEMGHAFGLGHAPCPAPGTPGAPSGIDSLLPAALRYPGLDVPLRTVIPSGTGELMSYCGGPSRWPSEDYWEFVRTRVPI